MGLGDDAMENLQAQLRRMLDDERLATRKKIAGMLVDSSETEARIAGTKPLGVIRDHYLSRSGAFRTAAEGVAAEVPAFDLPPLRRPGEMHPDGCSRHFDRVSLAENHKRRFRVIIPVKTWKVGESESKENKIVFWLAGENETHAIERLVAVFDKLLDGE